MPITDIPILSMLRTRMQWHQERQRCWPKTSPMPIRRITGQGPGAAEFRAASCRPRRSALDRTNPDHIAAATAAARSSPTDGSAPLRGAAARQLGQPRRRDDEGGVATRWITRRSTALYTHSLASDQDGDRQDDAGGLTPRRSSGRNGIDMDFIKSLAIAASGLRAQIGRMRIISENIANADSVAATPGGDPYRRKIVTFTSELDRALGAQRGQARPGRKPTIPIFRSSTSPAIRPPTPTATSNIRTSIRSWK